MRIRWLTGATQSLRAAHRYIAAKAAAKVTDRIKRAVERLATYPSFGRPGRRPGTRELVVPGVPFIVIYRISDVEVQILRVFHTSRNWWGLV